MSQVTTTFADSTYSSSNKPSTTTLKADIQALETAHNDTDTNAVTLTGSQTMTNKQLTSPVINTQITGTAIVDEDNMASDSALKVPTQQSVKAYVTSGAVTMTNKSISGATNTLSVLSAAWPIGSVFTAVVSTDPNTLLGFGTWSSIAAGRMLIGLDSGDTKFDTVEETGGAETVTLTSTELPAHTHTVSGATTGGSGGVRIDAGSGLTATSSSTGSGAAFSIMNPYFVVYFWKRVS